MNTFTWIHKTYNNRSLDNLSKNITEYNTIMLLNRGFNVEFSDTIPTNGKYSVEGTLFVDTPLDYYTVEHLGVVNFLSDHNVYFKHNTEDLIDVGAHKDSYNCLVSLAAGTSPVDLLERVGKVERHYIVDISTTAIKETNSYFNEFFVKERTEFSQLDFFNLENVKQFLETVEGKKGLIIISNCFCYAPTSLLYDTKLRLEKQNELMQLLATDKIEWYVDILTADGLTYRNVLARDLINQQLDKRLEIIPWI
jgi:hypothetical protein